MTLKPRCSLCVQKREREKNWNCYFSKKRREGERLDVVYLYGGVVEPSNAPFADPMIVNTKKNAKQFLRQDPSTSLVVENKKNIFCSMIVA